jgi:hypothetical protein
MRIRPLILWAILVSQLSLLAAIAVASLGGGDAIDTAFESIGYWLMSQLDDRHAIQIVASIFRFFIAWWFFILLIACMASYLSATVYVLCEKSASFLERLLWVAAFWLAGILAIPLYCILRLRSLAKGSSDPGLPKADTATAA